MGARQRPGTLGDLPGFCRRLHNFFKQDAARQWQALSVCLSIPLQQLLPLTPAQSSLRVGHCASQALPSLQDWSASRWGGQLFPRTLAPFTPAPCTPALPWLRPKPQPPHSLCLQDWRFAWVELFAADSERAYFINQETQHTTWDRPVDLGGCPDQLDAGGGEGCPRARRERGARPGKLGVGSRAQPCTLPCAHVGHG